MSHSRRIDRLNPALIVMLVDQSDSMSEPMAGSDKSKSHEVADQINNLLYELVLRCVKTPREPARPYFFVSILGYSTTESGESWVESGLVIDDEEREVVSATELARQPRRVDRRAGSTANAAVNRPIWIEPVSRGGTPMCAALDRAGRIAAGWTVRYSSAFPPIVLNFSDGEATDGSPLVWADRVRSLSTEDGNVLLFNINLSTESVHPSLFPAGAAGLPDQYARQLFEMSSPLPSGMMASARSQGLALQEGARGFAYNADINALALFLNVGTSVGRFV